MLFLVPLFLLNYFLLNLLYFCKKVRGLKLPPPQPLPLRGPCNFKERPQSERSIRKKTADRLHFDDNYNSQDLTSRTDHLHVR